MNRTPEPRSVYVLTPVGSAIIADVRSAEDLPKQYANIVQKQLRDKLRDRALAQLINGFVSCTGLVVLDPNVSNLSQSHQTGSLVV